MPIAFAFGLGTFAYLALSTRTPLSVVVGRMDEGMSHLILLSVPLFIFLGLIIEITGMARTMVGALASLLGHVRGGLQYVLIAAMYLASGISGAKAADMAAVAPVLFPEMKGRGAPEGELVALLAATGAQTETIPPSLVLITIGSVTGVSIAALFTGGLLPGLILAIALCGVVRWRCRDDDLTGVSRASGSEIATAFLVAAPALVLPLVIRAAVVEGVATATEVSTIGIAYVLLYGLVAALLFWARVDWRRLGRALLETACLSGAILLIIGTVTAMVAWALTRSGFSRQLATTMTGLPCARGKSTRPAATSTRAAPARPGRRIAPTGTASPSGAWTAAPLPCPPPLPCSRSISRSWPGVAWPRPRWPVRWPRSPMSINAPVSCPRTAAPAVRWSPTHWPASDVPGPAVPTARIPPTPEPSASYCGRSTATTWRRCAIGR